MSLQNSLNRKKFSISWRIIKATWNNSLLRDKKFWKMKFRSCLKSGRRWWNKTVNTLFNKVLSENEKCIFYFSLKTKGTLWPTQYCGTLLSHKREWNSAICSNIDEPRNYHTKQSKSEREKQTPSDSTYVWNLKYGTCEHISKTDSDREQTCGCKGQGGKDWEFRISRCKLIHRMDKQQGPTVYHGELYSISCDKS